jgi:hypothetical protein
MKSHELTPKQDRAAALLAAGATVIRAAAEVGAGERTIYDWLALDEFKKRVSAYQSRLIDEALGKLAEALTKAVETLVECLGSKESDSVRVRAALGILDQVIRIRESTIIEQRLTAIEARLPGVHNPSEN